MKMLSSLKVTSQTPQIQTVKKVSQSHPQKQLATKKGNLEIVTKFLSQIEPHPDNVRVHPEENIKAIVRSLTDFGQRTPIVIWKDATKSKTYIIKGNGTYEAAKRLKFESIDCVDCSHLSNEQAQAYAIADNKTGDLSHFDYSKLADAFRYLEGKNLDLESTGFQAFESEPLLIAEFKPANVGDLPNPDAVADFKTIKFTKEQWEIVETILPSIRTLESEFDTASEAAALTCLCYRIGNVSLDVGFKAFPIHRQGIN